LGIYVGPYDSSVLGLVCFYHCAWGPTPTRSRSGARRLALLARAAGAVSLGPAVRFPLCGIRCADSGIALSRFPKHLIRNGSRTTDHGSRKLFPSKRLGGRISGPEVLQQNERIDVALVFDSNTGLRRRRCDEHFVLGHLSVANHGRSGHG